MKVSTTQQGQLRRASAWALGVIVCTSACGGNRGVLKTPRTTWVANQTFEDPGRMVFRTRIGLQSQSLGPSAGDMSPKVILDAKYSIHAVNADGSLWILGDSSTNLYVWRRAIDPAPVEVKALRGRASSQLLTPDHKTLVVARHADFSRPQAQWDKNIDDTLYLVDIQSLAVTTIKKKTGRWVTQMTWGDVDETTKLPAALYLRLAQTKKSPETIQRIDWSTKVRTKVADAGGKPFYVAVQQAGFWGPVGRDVQCASGGIITSDDTGIALKPNETSVEADWVRLVKLEDRKRGFHDYQPTFETVRFGPSCALVYFKFNGTIFSVTARPPHKIAELTAGSEPIFLTVVDDTP